MSFSVRPTCFVFVVACSPAASPATVDRAGAEQMIAKELDGLHEAASRADEAAYFAHFDEAGVFLGTDAKERWTVPAFRAYAHASFSHGKGWTFHPTRRAITISSDGNVAWFDEDLMGERLGPTRGSGVLVHRGARWLVVQYNLTFTVPNEKFDAFKAMLSPL